MSTEVNYQPLAPNFWPKERMEILKLGSIIGFGLGLVGLYIGTQFKNELSSMDKLVISTTGADWEIFCGTLCVLSKLYISRHYPGTTSEDTDLSDRIYSKKFTRKVQWTTCAINNIAFLNIGLFLKYGSKVFGSGNNDVISIINSVVLTASFTTFVFSTVYSMYHHREPGQAQKI